MAQLFKDPYFNIWHGSVSLRGVVVKRLSGKVWTVTTVENGAQFNSKAKAFKAAQSYLDNGISPYDDPNNLARLWDEKD